MTGTMTWNVRPPPRFAGCVPTRASWIHIAIAWAFLTTASAPAFAAAPQSKDAPVMDLGRGVFAVLAFTTEPGKPRRLLVADDGGLSLVDWEDKGRVVARLARGDSRTFAWCVAGDAGEAQEIFVVRDRGVVSSWRGGDAVERVVDRAIRLPAGVYRLPFARDIDGDRRADLALPHGDGFQLWRRDGDGFRKGPLVRHEVDVDVTVSGRDDASPSFSRRVRIPAFQIEDQNGDGREDLVFRDEDHVQFYWTDATGALPEEPTFELDLEKIRSDLPKRTRGILDPSNLLSVLESQVSHFTRDLDEDGCFDLLLRRGPKVSIYRGTAAGVDRSQAAQVLRTGGNLLAVYAMDDDGDGRLDLSLLLVSDIPIAKVLVWLVAGSDLTLDLFVYRQEDALKFARKPTRRRSLTVNVPSLANLEGALEGGFEDLSNAYVRATISGDLDGGGARDDVVRIDELGLVSVFANADPAAPLEDAASVWKEVLDRFDREAKGGDDLTVDVAELVPWIPVPGTRLDALVEHLQPTRTLDVSVGFDAPEDVVIFLLDLSGDGVDDVVVVGGDERGVRLAVHVSVGGGG